MNNEKNVFWYLKKDPVFSKKLEGEVSADIVVVGGGIAGLSCAQRFRDAGKDVIIVEKDFCGAGASGKSSGFITPDSEIELGSLIANHGPEKAKEIWEFVCSGVEKIRSNIKQYHIECDYQVQDSLFIANDSAGVLHVGTEHKSRRSLSYDSILYDSGSISQVIGSEKYKAGVRYPSTFGMNSYLYCQGMREILIKSGVRIYENTRVLKIHSEGVETNNGYVHAPHIIVCGDRFIPELGVLKKEIYHVQTFLGISKPLTDAKIKEIFPENRMMVWDTDLIYNYFRVTGDNRLLLGGGDIVYTYAHSISSNTKRFKRRLTAYFKKKFPKVDIDLEYTWAGMLGVSKDLLPIMGADDHMKNVWYVGAASGLPWATALGIYAADKVVAGRSEFDDDFSWRRKFIINSRLQSILTTPVTYAISHGITKYLK
ncbi:MAG: FAD-binding oxidoreductase [bacterium]|nr:FAD-binding oxidoreductase [bacterium]